MTSKIDKSLIEVWEMKERAYQRFKDSGMTSYVEYIKNRMKIINDKYYAQSIKS
jgi:hypothetical protein